MLVVKPFNLVSKNDKKLVPIDRTKLEDKSNYIILYPTADTLVINAPVNDLENFKNIIEEKGNVEIGSETFPNIRLRKLFYLKEIQFALDIDKNKIPSKYQHLFESIVVDPTNLEISFDLLLSTPEGLRLSNFIRYFKLTLDEDSYYIRAYNYVISRTAAHLIIKIYSNEGNEFSIPKERLQKYTTLDASSLNGIKTVFNFDTLRIFCIGAVIGDLVNINFQVLPFEIIYLELRCLLTSLGTNTTTEPFNHVNIMTSYRIDSRSEDARKVAYSLIATYFRIRSDRIKLYGTFNEFSAYILGVDEPFYNEVISIINNRGFVSPGAISLIMKGSSEKNRLALKKTNIEYFVNPYVLSFTDPNPSKTSYDVYLDQTEEINLFIDILYYVYRGKLYYNLDNPSLVKVADTVCKTWRLNSTNFYAKAFCSVHEKI